MTDFAKDVSKPEYDRIRDGHVHSVRGRCLGVARDGDSWTYVADGDPGFEVCDFKVRAYVCCDSKKRSDDEQELKTVLRANVKELNGRRFDGRRGRTGDPVRARGRMPIKFLALTIRVRMQIAVSGCKVKNLTVENARMSASTYGIVKDRGVNVRSEKTKRVRDIFEVFGVEDPGHLEPVSRTSWSM